MIEMEEERLRMREHVMNEVCASTPRQRCWCEISELHVCLLHRWTLTKTDWSL